MQRLLERAIKDILNDPKAKPGEKLKAVEKGCALLALRHKIGESGGGGGFFPTA